MCERPGSRGVFFIRSHGPDRKLPQNVEHGSVEFEEGGKFQIGGAPFGEVKLIGGGNDDTFHAGRFGRNQAIEGTLETNALDGAGAELLGAVDIDLRMRLAIGKRSGGRNGPEPVADPQLGNDGVYEFERGGGGQADAKMPF
jgi:hypothetical protein